MLITGVILLGGTLTLLLVGVRPVAQYLLKHSGQPTPRTPYDPGMQERTARA